MSKQTYQFEDFIKEVNPLYEDFVREMHSYFLDNGCGIGIKLAKMGYVVSYINNATKKTVANYVFRKKGIMIRIYANNLAMYADILENFPEEMKEAMKKASVCKRLMNPADCNSRCSMGYDFVLDGERYKKCRNSAFMFLVDDESSGYIRSFIEKELEMLKG